MKRKRTNREYIPRKMYKFWLRTDREGEARLMQYIQYCKQTRQFASKVRDGLRLIWSLSEGNTSVLFELFPHLEQILKSPALPPPSTPDGGNMDIERLITTAALSAAQQVIDQLPALPPPPPGYPAMKESGASRNTLGQGATFTAPTEDEDDDDSGIVVTKKEQHMGMLTAVLALMEGDATLSGKNLTAAENAKSLAARRLS